MAARKSAVEPEPVEDAQPYDTGLDARDISFSRLTVVGNQARHVVARRAHPGDLAIGDSAEDEDAIIVEAPGGIRFYILQIRANYACGFDGPKGQWEEGDPNMPPDARRQYNLTLYCPDHDTSLPVVYTAGGTAAGIVRRGLNKKYAVTSITGDPVGLCFEVTTELKPHDKGPYPVPVFKLVESKPNEVAAAKAMRDLVIGSASRQQITAGDDAETPGF